MREFDLGAVTAYAIAVKHGFKGTEAEWAAYMQANAVVAKEAEANAKRYAENAKTSANNASQSAKTAQSYEQNAHSYAQNAAKSAQRAEEAANKAGGIKTVNGKTPDENGNVEIEVGSGGGVSSWNDLTDKPFGEETGIVEILPETTLTSPAEEPGAFYITENPPALENGKTYIVNWNGTEYSATAFDSTEIMNEASVMLVDDSTDFDTGEGVFAIVYVVGAAILMLADMVGSTELTISIKQEQTIVTPLPTKYLPDGVPYCIDGGMVEVLAECQPTPTDDGIFILVDAIDIVPGETYTVQWNGVEYRCVAQAVEEDGLTSAVLGDLGALDGMPPTGEPFIIVAYPPEIVASDGLGGMILPIDGTTELTLAIYSGGTEIRKLDNRCLDLAWLPITKPGGTKEVLAETTFTSSSGNYNSLKTPLGITAGERYIVNFNGVEYERVAFTALIVTGYEFVKTTLGNESDPFTIMEIDEATAAALSWPFRVQIQQRVSTETFDYTISVKGYVNVPDKMPEEFLPESVDGVIIRSSTEGSTKKFKLTIDDSGAITATEVTA